MYCTLIVRYCVLQIYLIRSELCCRFTLLTTVAVSLLPVCLSVCVSNCLSHSLLPSLPPVCVCMSVSLPPSHSLPPSPSLLLPSSHLPLHFSLLLPLCVCPSVCVSITLSERTKYGIRNRLTCLIITVYSCINRYIIP